MHFLKHFLLLAVLSLAFISCEDEVSDIVPGYIGVRINAIDYQIITAHKSFYEEDFQPANVVNDDYSYGAKVIINLDNPSRKEIINRLIVSSGIFGYNFTREELQEAWADSVNGYVLDLIIFCEGDNLYPINYLEIKIFDNDGNASNLYQFQVDLTLPIKPHVCSGDWGAPNSWEVALNDIPSAINQIAETHFLNSNNLEILVDKSPVAINKWTVDEIPIEAVSFYYILTDTVSNIKRKFISAKYSITGRFPDNIDYIDNADFPSQLEYINTTDQMIALSVERKELILLNCSDYGIIWKRPLTHEPKSFSYYTGSNVIYLLYKNNVVDSINSANGNGAQLFKYNDDITEIIPLDNDILIYPSAYKMVNVYDMNTKKITPITYTEPIPTNYFRDGIYNSKEKIVYVNQGYFVDSYKFDASSKTLTDIGTGNIVYTISPYMQGLVLNQDMSRLFAWQGDVYDKNLSYKKRINPLIDLANLPGGYIATINPDYADYYTDTWNVLYYPSSITIYDESLNLKGKKTHLTGTPMKIYSKDNDIKIFSIQKSGKLIVQKFTLDEILSMSGKLNANFKIYKMDKL